MAVINLAQVASPSAPSASTDNIFIDTSGNLSIQKPDGNIVKLAAAGTYTLTIPATGTAALLATAQTFSAAQTFSNVLTAPGMKPASNATNALEFENAGGTPILTIDTTNSRVITAGDVFPRSDTVGLRARLVDGPYTWTSHFESAFTDFTWEAGTHDGTPDIVSLSGSGSLASWVRFADAVITDDFFASLACGATVTFAARMWLNQDSYGGIRIDDGSLDNSIELRLEQNATYGLRNLVAHHTVGGSLTSTTLLTGINGLMPMTLELTKNATVYIPAVHDQAPFQTRLVSGSVASVWNATRAGLIFGQRGATATDFRRSMYVDAYYLG